MKKRMLAMLLLITMLTGALPARAETRERGEYEAAMALMAVGNNAQAAQAFAALGDFDDSPRWAMYCRALDAASRGNYSQALTDLEALGDFKDSRLRVIYYAARVYEELQDYEQAETYYADIPDFLDTPQRRAALPALIRARDEAAAEAKRARDYAAADQLEKDGKPEEALKAFETLGDYKDSRERAAALRQQLKEAAESQAAQNRADTYAEADRLEKEGKYGEAYTLFVSLGGYKDSAQRAEAIRLPGEYQNAQSLVSRGKLKEALALYRSLGDYEDCPRRAYILSTVEFAESFKMVDAYMFAYQFHTVWGIADVENGLILPARWDAVADAYDTAGHLQMTSNGKVGVIDRKGDILCAAKYHSISAFGANGLAKAQRNGLYGYVDRSYNEVIPCNWYQVSDFRGGLCTVVKMTTRTVSWYEEHSFYLGFANEKGELLSDAKWRTLGDSANTLWQNKNNRLRLSPPVFTQGFLRAESISGKWSLLNSEGKALGEGNWDVIGSVSENLMAVKKNDLWGYIDLNGETVIKPQFAEAADFHQGLALVRDKGTSLLGYIGHEGQMRIGPAFEKATDFGYSGTADVYYSNEGWHIIDTTGKRLYFLTGEFEKAEELMTHGRYPEAARLFEGIPNDETAAQRALEARYLYAEELLAKGDIGAAAEAFKNCGTYRDALQRMQKFYYENGEALIAEGKWAEAIAAFEKAGNYEDAAIRVYEPYYRQGEICLNEGKWEEAVAFFEKADSYADAKARICEAYYQLGESLLTESQYSRAYNAFMKAQGFKDSSQKAHTLFETHKDRILNSAAVGDMLCFGHYEQDGNTSNGKEPIEWQVLDKQDGRLLVISRYGLDCKPYNTKDKDITWEKSTLRKWLNKDFMKAAFSKDEQKLIPTVKVSADKNPNYNTKPGKDTKDQVFLLSIREVNKYFTSYYVMKCDATVYAKQQGVGTNYDNSCSWWLRSPGYNQNVAVNVSSGGTIMKLGYVVSNTSYAVRPAMWIEIAP